MSGEERRNQLLRYLSDKEHPISGTVLSQKFGVSRQIIVQDIALLRSAHVDIISTNRGYMLPETHKSNVIRVYKCCHTDEQAEDELNCIVDQGGTIINVFVNHKIYGRIHGDMNIRCRRDVNEYIDGIHSGKSALLKKVTSDYHYHTISAENESVLNDIENELAKRGYLVIQKDNK